MKLTSKIFAALITFAIAGSAAAADTRSWTSSDESPYARSEASKTAPGRAPVRPATSTDEARANAAAQTSASAARATTARGATEPCACHHRS